MKKYIWKINHFKQFQQLYFLGHVCAQALQSTVQTYSSYFLQFNETVFQSSSSEGQ